MKSFFQECTIRYLLLYTAILSANVICAYTCLPAVKSDVASINNTYFTGQQTPVSAESTYINDKAPYGTTPVPMKFVAINGKRNGTNAQINWEVTDEKDLTNYIIERSYNGYEYSTVGIVGNKPDKEQISKYSFSDALTGKEAVIYYRIKAQNLNDETFFSKVITIQTVLRKEDMLDISPVPAKRYTMIKWSSTESSKLTVSLFDVSGRFVFFRQYLLRKGVNELLLTNLEALPAGVYFIKASDGVNYRNGELKIQQ